MPDLTETHSTSSDQNYNACNMQLIKALLSTTSTSCVSGAQCSPALAHCAVFDLLYTRATWLKANHKSHLYCKVNHTVFFKDVPTHAHLCMRRYHLCCLLESARQFTRLAELNSQSTEQFPVLLSFLGPCSLVTTNQIIVPTLVHHLQLSTWQQRAGTQTLCM